MDIPFLIFAMYNAIALLIGVMGIILGVKKIDGAPLISVIAGFMFLLPIIFVENVTMGYTEERSILVSSLEIAGTGANITTVHYNITDTDGQYALNAGGRIFLGEELSASSSLIGDTINKVSVYLVEVGSPTGNYLVGVWDSTATPTAINYIELCATVDATTITSSVVEYTYDCDDYILESGDIIGVYYAGGDGSNRVAVRSATTGNFDGTNTRVSGYISSWSDATADDMAGAFYHVVAGTSQDAQIINSHDTVGASPINYAFNQNDVWVFSIVLGILFVFMAITIQFAKLS